MNTEETRIGIPHKPACKVPCPKRAKDLYYDDYIICTHKMHAHHYNSHNGNVVPVPIAELPVPSSFSAVTLTLDGDNRHTRIFIIKQNNLYKVTGPFPIIIRSELLLN